MVPLRWVIFGVLLAVAFADDAAEKKAIEEIVKEEGDAHPEESRAQRMKEARTLVKKIEKLRMLKEKVLLKQYPQLKERLRKNRPQHKTVEDVRSLEGDMDPTEDQVDALITEYSAQLGETDAAFNKRMIKDFAIFPGYKWDSAIKYCITGLKTDVQKNAVKAAVNDYKAKIPCLSWAEVSSCVGQTNCMNFVPIMDPAPVTSCHGHSPVGRSYGEHSVHINNCDNLAIHTGVIIHEMGHSLGLPHTQSRSDRDTYVTIQWANIIAGKDDQFLKEESNVVKSFGTAYDYASVMHYGPGTFASGSAPTIKTIDTSKQNIIGKASALSTIDVELLKKAYCDAALTPECREPDKVYKLGETKIEAPWYKACQVTQYGNTAMMYAGCAYNGAKYANGQKWMENGWVYMCVVGSDGSLSKKLAGCAINGQMKNFGSNWVEGSGTFQWIKECLSSANGGASIGTGGCYLNYGTSVGGVKAGCAAKVGSYLVKCPKFSDGRVSFSYSSYTDSGLQSSLGTEGITSISCPAPVTTR